jgi:DNA repair exonuclease SbcCD ATPase subunit
MQIKKLKLTNAFQHASLEVPFTPFTSIVGANGSGKSNIIESIGLALSGTFTLPGKLESTIREGQEKGRIDMVIESEGDEIELVTHLGKSSRKLTRKCPHTELSLSKATEVLEYLQNTVLKTPFPIMNSSSIIRQGQLDAGLFDTAAKRTDTFMRMAGLSDIEKKRQQLADAKAQVTVPMLSFSVADAEKKVQELQAYLDKTKAERDAIPAYDQIKLTACKQLISTKNLVDQAVKELKGAEAELTTLTAADADSKDILAVKTAYREEMASLVKELQPLADQARVVLSGHARQQKDWTSKVTAQKGLDAAKDSLSNLMEVPADFDGSGIDELANLLTEIRTKSRALTETVAAFAQPVAQCPTCRRGCTVQEASGILQSAKAEQEELVKCESEVLTELNNAKLARTNWQKERNTFVSARDELRRSLDVCTQSLKNLEHVTQPGSVEEQNQAVKDHQEAQLLLSNAAKDEATVSQLCSDTNTQLQVCRTKVESLRKQAALSYGGAAFSFNDAVQHVTEYEAGVRKIAELDGVMMGTRKQLVDEQARLEKLKQQTEEAKLLTQYCEYLEFARTALHRDNFPSGKVKAFVDRMLINANMYLDAMQAGFSVSYDKDDGFIAFFPRDNKHMRADRLSGGEKVTFALAFRFAVNDLHTDTGFLILDEPTVWLDDKHIDYVINALQLVKTKIVPRVQLIIVTHDEKLAAVADSVFEVKK